MEDFCHKMPKVELHAHLAGSVPEDVVKRLLEERDNNCPEVMTSLHGQRRTMTECFEVFSCLHRAIFSLETLKVATKAVLECFAIENTVYLELRSTPRAFDASSSKRDYMSTVMEGVAAFGGAMRTRLLVSVDRSKSVEEARENVELAIDLKKTHPLGHMIVGMDLSGNPAKGDLGPLIPLLNAAVKEGLKICLHACEMQGMAQECLEVLQQVPVSRIGHGTYIHSEKDDSNAVKEVNKKLVELIREKRIPIETCVSSNLCTNTCSDVKQHHFGFWRDLGHPVCLSTDDRGVFQTTLSREFVMCTETFKLTSANLLSLSLDSADACLLPDEEKLSLKKEIQDAWKLLPALASS